jgi:hypothetical protein
VPCIFCIAAIAIAAATFVPALVDAMGDRLRTASPDLRKVVDTEETAMWTGTFSFMGADNRPKTAKANVTIYKASKRARIQATTHELSGSDAIALQNTIAGLLGATIISRHDGREAALPATAMDTAPQVTTEAPSGSDTIRGNRTPSQGTSKTGS